MHARERLLKIPRKQPRKKQNGRDRHDDRKPVDGTAWMRDWLEEQIMDTSPRVRPDAVLRPGPRKSLPEAILIEMNKYGMSMAELVDQTRLSRVRLNEIIDGSLPTAYEFRRLRHGMPRLAYLFTEAELSPERIIELEREERKKDPEIPRWTPPPAEEPVPEPPPGTFGEALLRAIRDEDIAISAVAGMIGVTDQAVRFWISDSNVPVRDNYENLIHLFPVLSKAPAPKSEPQDIEKPVGNPYGREGDVPMAAPRPTPIIERKNHVTPVPPPPPAALPAPPTPPAPPPALPVSTMSTAENRRDLVRLGVQVAALLAEMDPKHIGRLIDVLVRAGGLTLSPVELADVLRDYSPQDGL